MNKNIFLVAIVGFSFILRLLVINQSLWLDEAIGALAVKNENYVQILTDFPKNDNHPPLYYLTLKAWTDIFGYSEVSLRSLSVIFGVLTVYLIYKIGKNLDSRLIFLPALLLATSGLHIYYSQEARMYVMAGFLATAAFYLFLLNLDKKTEKPLNWIFFSLSVTALVFTDYVPVFLLPVFPLFGFLRKMSKNWWKKLFLSALPLVLFGLAWLPTLLRQVQAGRKLLITLPAWKEVAGGASFKQMAVVWMKFVLGRIALTDKTVYYLLVIFFSISLLVVLAKAWSKREKVLPIWLYLVVPLVLGFITSIFFPAFIYFRFIFVLPAFYLIVSWGINQFGKTVRLSLIFLILLGNLVGWLIYVKEPNQQREQWREAVNFVESRVGPKEIVVFNFTEPFASYRWYTNGKVLARGVADSIPINPGPTKDITTEAISSKNGVYYFEYLWELHDPARVVEKTIEDDGFIRVSAFDFSGVGIISYWRKI